MPKVTKIINGEYIGGEKYTITDAGEGKSIISFSPDTVLKEGTPVGAEILNEMQKNGIYSLIGTRNISGQKEIYTCNIDGINDFGLFDIVLIVTPNITNTTQNIYLDLSGNEFQIIGNNIISAGDLQANEPYIFKLTSITKKAFLIGSDKLKKGTYSGDAGDLNTEISKIASTTQLGRIIVGDNLTIDEAGRLSGKKVDLSNYYDKPEIEEKFKNFCPYSIGDIYITTLSTNPATKYLGTTWQKIEGKFLLSTSGSNASGQIGGSNTKTISKANLPNVKLQVDSFSLTTTKHIHGLRGNAGGDLGILFQQTNVLAGIQYGGTGSFSTSTNVMAEGGGQNTGAAAPYTSALGSGTPLDITPAYYTVHIWKRLT